MRHRARRRPGRRLVLIVAALTSLIIGYYLGQHFQRRALDEVSAVIYPSGQQIDYPAALTIPSNAQDDGNWRLYLVVDTGKDTCRAVLRHYALMINRLAAWPEIQARLRVVALAYDDPDDERVADLTSRLTWLDLVGGERSALDALSERLGIAPLGSHWCSPTQANAVLVSPEDKAWALIPYEQPAIMARNLSTIIAFVE